MSIYATTYSIDENTGEVTLVKHLNKLRVDRCLFKSPGKHGKNGKKARLSKRFKTSRYNEKIKAIGNVAKQKVSFLDDEWE